MVRQTRAEWKQSYLTKIGKLLNEYDKCFIVNVDNVRSRQMQHIRINLRGTAELILGKNTMMKKAIQLAIPRNSNLEKLLPCVKQNVGFVFTTCDLGEVRVKIEDNKVQAPAKAGAIASCDVTIPAQATTLPPDKTSFFGSLGIATKISRGSIEILNDVQVVKKGCKVGMNEATLLSMLKIYPFQYGLVIKQVYENGSVYDPCVLDITPQIVMERFMSGLKNVTALSLALSYTTIASVPHLLINGFKNLLAVSAMTDYTFEESKQIKEYLLDPSKFVVAAAAPAVAASKQEPAKADTKKATPEPEEEEDDDDFGLALFD